MIIWEFSLKIIDKSLVGKKPPEEIIVSARFKESKVRIEKIFKTTNIKTVNEEYNKKILIACLMLSALLNDVKFVRVFLKLSS